jgi:hypothetical protein
MGKRWSVGGADQALVRYGDPTIHELELIS